MPPQPYLSLMRLARLRRFAWVLVLVLTTGLAAPAFASMVAVESDPVFAAAHVHADGSTHVHGPATAGQHAQPAAASKAEPWKVPLHCPGCATAAECAVACLGVGVLPSMAAVAGVTLPKRWLSAQFTEPAGAALSGDLDPPRPVSVR